MNILSLDAIGQAKKIKDGEISPLELLDAVIARIEALDPTCTGICSIQLDLAREKALHIPKGPFQGVPFLIKDLLPYPGMAFTAGSRLFAQYIPKNAPEYIDKIDKSGLITFGKTTTSEFGLLGSTETLLHGPTRHFLDEKLSVGGSSGGAAAAVSAGIVPMAHGNDGGGSIRIPASINGLFGFKPSRGRSVNAISVPEPSPLSLLVDHCITKSVRDSACFLSITERKDRNALYPPVGFVKGAIGKKFKIGYYTCPSSGKPITSEAETVLNKTIERCRDLGHELIQIDSPKVDAAVIGRAFFTFAGASIDTLEKMVAKMLPQGLGEDHIEPFTLWVRDLFRKTDPEYLQVLGKTLIDTESAIINHLNKVDITLCPTQPYPARELGYLSPSLDPELLIKRTIEFAGYTAIHNIAGAPAMSVPLFTTINDLPLGSHFASKPGKDLDLLELAYQLLGN